VMSRRMVSDGLDTVKGKSGESPVFSGTRTVALIHVLWYMSAHPTTIHKAKSDRTLTTPPQKARVDRDLHGVYEITGRDPFDVAFQFGRIQARHHTLGLFSALAATAGRLASFLGPAVSACPARDLRNDPHVRSDLETRRFRFLENGRRLLRGLHPSLRPWMDGFARGIETTRKEVLRKGLPQCLDSPQARRLLTLRVTPALICALDFRLAARHEFGRLSMDTKHASASNAVAVGGRRARGGGGLLLIDPHIPLLASPELRMLAVRLRTRGYEAAGMARLGSPLVFLGFSRYLAWTVTTNWPNTLRYSILRRQGDHFLGGGGKVKRLLRECTIQVYGRGERRFPLAFAGRLDRPIVHSLPGGRVAAVELAGARAGDLTTQLYTAARVRTVTAFRRRVLAIPGAAHTNFIVADRDGRIGCFWHGRVPKAGGGFLDPVREMPADHGGEEGILVQNNAHFDRVRPGCTTRLTDFPPRVADGAVSLSSFRQDRTLTLLGRKSKIGLGDLEDVALDVRDLRGGLFVRRMTEAIRTSRGIERWPVSRRRRLHRALGEARKWDRRLSKGNTRATLVMMWMENTFRLWPPLAGMFNRAETVPDSPPAHVALKAARALLEAVGAWRRRGRPAWGEVHQLALGSRRFGVSGSTHVNRAAGWLVRPDTDAGTLDFPVEAGSTCVIAVHLRKDRVRGRFMKVLGPVETPDSPLFTLNAEAWAAGRFHPLHLECRGGTPYNPSKATGPGSRSM